MELEYHGPRSFKRTVLQYIEKLSPHYDREDPVRVCTGPFGVDYDGSIVVDKEKNSQLEKLLQIENRAIGITDGKPVSKKKFYSTLKQIKRILNNYKLNGSAGIYHDRKDVVIVKMGDLYAIRGRDISTQLGLQHEDYNYQFMGIFEGTLAHELTHWDLADTDFMRDMNRADPQSTHRLTYLDFETPGGLELPTTGKINDIESKEERIALYTKLIGFKNEFAVLNEATAHAVADVLCQTGPPCAELYSSKADPQELMRTYQKIREKITKFTVKSMIRHVKDIANKTYENQTNPFELI